ncbi:MAG: hypothetical protein E6J91_14610, partial [Deltaproteobacteria bacterium]
MTATVSHRVRSWLQAASPAVFATYAVIVAFATYFTMYSFRKPFAAAAYAGQTFWIVDLKTALVIGQLAGYALSKMLGIKFNSEMRPERRAWALVILIGWAELALVAFAVVPAPYKV